MKILIDINHPAHVHYFRNFIKLMEAKGHQFFVINRDSKMINQLLDYYGIEHTIRNKRPKRKGAFVSMLNLIWMTLWCIKKSLFFHPDLYMGFASSACAITSRFFRKTCILMDDTEHNVMNHKIYKKFCSAVLTPFYFNKDLWKGKKSKQIRFNAFVEQLYLHDEQYKKNVSILEELNVKAYEYVIVRYIAYDAHHDKNVHPLSVETKMQIVREISKYYKVFVSLEASINNPFYDNYLLKISPEKIHDLEAYAKFMITEGATMASESFILGVPYLYINPLKCGYIFYQCNNYPKRCFQTIEGKEVLAIVSKLLKSEMDNELERLNVEQRTINPTNFLVWFVENYPESNRIMLETPDYQYKFR